MLHSLDSGRIILPSDEFSADIKNSVCITGHREKSISAYRGEAVNYQKTVTAVRMMLYRCIDMAVEKGCKTFFSGLAVGTDLWAGEYIIKLKKENPQIKLVGVMPFIRHSEHFSPEYRRLLTYVEENADELLTVSTNPDIIYSSSKSDAESNSLYKNRNYFMVDNSGAVIAFHIESKYCSGTAQTLNYARRRGRKIIKYSLDDVYDMLDSSGGSIERFVLEAEGLENLFDMPY